MKVGEKVCMINNPSYIGEIKRYVEDGDYCYVAFEDGSTTLIKSEELKPFSVEVSQDDLPTLVANKRFSSVEDVRREITKIRLTGNLNDMLYSMGSTHTDFYAHQFKPVMKIINSISNSILIADEVGLGKTIEAGLIWTELKQRYNFKRLLIVCPGILCDKWRAELKNRIGVKADIIEAKDLWKRYKEDEDTEFTYICGLQGLSRQCKTKEDKGRNETGKKYSKTVEEQFKEISDSGGYAFDLIVFDEAHYARNTTTKAHKIIKVLRDVSEYAVFLTATPIQNRRDDLLSLLSILDENNFNLTYAKSTFNDLLRINAPLNKLRDKLLAGRDDTAELLQLIDDVYQEDNLGLFKNNRRLKMMQNEIEQPEISIERLHELAYMADSINSLGYILNRTRKRDIQENRVIRRAKAENIPMSETEQKVYDTVTQAVREYAREHLEEKMAAFLLCTPQRMISSSVYPTLRKWKRKDSEVGYDDASERNTEAASKNTSTKFMEYIYKAVSNFGEDKLAKLYNHDTKYERLIHVLKQMQEDYPDEKVVLFSSYIETLEYLHERLNKEEKPIKSILLHGKSENKLDIISTFQTQEDIKILLSSEVGSEGVDLQFCRLLINYDLPWNPMRVEQRIGRLDRIGQKADIVLIWNIFHDTTIDARVYDKLYDKFELCKEAFGDFETILTNTEEFQKLSLDLLLLDEEQLDKRLKQTKSAIENKRVMTDKLEEEASQLTAYGDYVLNEIQKNRQAENMITSEDVAVYVIETLEKLYNIVSIPTKENLKYLIHFNSEFQYDFGRFCRENNLRRNTLLLQEWGDVSCRFTNNAVFKTERDVEIINQFHPLVRFLQVKDTQPITALATVIQSEDDKNKGMYLIGVSQMSAEGMTKYERLIYNGINLQDISFISEDKAKQILQRALSRGTYWADYPNLNYKDLSKFADYIFLENQKVYEQKIGDLENENFDKSEMQIVTLKKHLMIKEEQFLDKIEKLRIKNQNSLIKAEEGKFNKLKDKITFKIEHCEKNKKLKFKYKNDLCIAFINVV